MTEGYCGADLEGIVREAIESVFVKKNLALTTAEIIEAINNMKKIYEDLKLKSASV